MNFCIVKIYSFQYFFPKIIRYEIRCNQKNRDWALIYEQPCFVYALSAKMALTNDGIKLISKLDDGLG